MAHIDYRNADPIEIRRTVIVALSDYVEKYGEISDDPDDLNSAAAAIWSALGASKHNKPNDRAVYVAPSQPETDQDFTSQVQTVVRDLFTAATAAGIISSDAFGALVYRLREYCHESPTNTLISAFRALDDDLQFCGDADNPAAFLAAKVRDLP